MKNILKRAFKNETVLAALLLLFVTLITYAPFIPKLGYYRDDWYLIWSGQVRGPESIISLFALDRPFMGYIYSLDYRLLVNTVINWHLYALFLRTLGVAGLFALLRSLWPTKKFATTAVVLIFIVYPGFLSTPIANTFQNHFFTYTTAILSMLFTVRALLAKTPVSKSVYWGLSLLTTALYLPVYEYMIGLEALRLIFIWYVYQEHQRLPWRKSIRKALLWYLPYLLIAGIFVYWRFFLFSSGRRATNEVVLLGSYVESPLRQLMHLGIETAIDFFDTVVFAWAIPPYRYLSNVEYQTLSVALAWTGLAVGLVLLYYYGIHLGDGHKDEEDAPRVFGNYIWIGILGVVAALLPVVFTGRQVLFNSFERYTLQATIGVGLLFVGLIYYASPKLRIWFVVVLVGIGVLTHTLNAASWAETWETQRGLWWQLSWRAPDIKDETVLFSFYPSSQRVEEGYETWAPANLIYRPEANPPAIVAEVLGSSTAPRLIKGEEKPNSDRDISYPRDFKNSLILTVPSSLSCMHAIDGNKPELSESEGPMMHWVAEYSDIGRIITEGASPDLPPEIFGVEPAHTWCYYYQKASLARQRGEWAEVVRLGEEALSQGYEPFDRSEWLPFLEAYVNTGQYPQASKLVEKLYGGQGIRYLVCQDLQEDPGYPENYGYDYEKIFEILCDS